MQTLGLPSVLVIVVLVTVMLVIVMLVIVMRMVVFVLIHGFHREGMISSPLVPLNAVH